MILFVSRSCSTKYKHDRKLVSWNHERIFNFFQCSLSYHHFSRPAPPEHHSSSPKQSQPSNCFRFATYNYHVQRGYWLLFAISAIFLTPKCLNSVTSCSTCWTWRGRWRRPWWRRRRRARSCSCSPSQSPGCGGGGGCEGGGHCGCDSGFDSGYGCSYGWYSIGWC